MKRRFVAVYTAGWTAGRDMLANSNAIYGAIKAACGSVARPMMVSANLESVVMLIEADETSDSLGDKIIPRLLKLRGFDFSERIANPDRFAVVEFTGALVATDKVIKTIAGL